MRHRIMVLGAGLAGLSAAHHLDLPCEVFEKETHVGGHCRTKAVDGFYFDEGAHVFFGQDECAQEFVWGPLKGEMISYSAEIWNNYGAAQYGRYPVQANAHALPEDVATRCVLDFIQAHGEPDVDVKTYQEWCYATFGQSFADEFMLRYARKVWTVEPHELNTEWLGTKVGGRISRPSLEQVIRGAIDRNPSELNYLTQFAYPREGGFGRIVAPLAATVPHVHLGCGVMQIESQARRMTFTDGSVRTYAAAISTVPLPSLVGMTVDAPAAVQAAAQRLMWTSLRCVNLGIARSDVGLGHWVYFYDHDIPFFRISFPSRFSSHNAPPGYSTISCEIAYSRRRPLDDHNLVSRVVEALRQTEILRPSDRIVFEDQMDVPYAYVVFDFERTESVRTVHTWMQEVGLYPCGRFGEWGYHWSFEAIESGKQVAAQVAANLAVTAPST